MRAELIRQLRDELGGGVAAMADLSDHDAENLLLLIRTGRSAEHEALVKAVNDTVKVLPWPFRGPIREIVFGGLR